MTIESEKAEAFEMAIGEKADVGWSQPVRSSWISQTDNGGRHHAAGNDRGPPAAQRDDAAGARQSHGSGKL
jgi:hypothetical protein